MGFQQAQLALTAHIRDPQQNAGPDGIEDRRLKIYRDLFYKNIEGFISKGFPVLRKLYNDENWHAMVRDFMRLHACESPYFAEIGQEFLSYLQHSRLGETCDPAFMLELAHYEWAEVAIDVMDPSLDALTAVRDGDLLAGQPKPSPLAWALSYQYPVHKIGPGYEPSTPPEQATVLIVYRDRHDTVKFMESNAITARLLAMLDECPADSGRDVLLRLATEMQHPEPETIVAFGAEILLSLRDAGVLLGTRV